MQALADRQLDMLRYTVFSSPRAVILVPSKNWTPRVVFEAGVKTTSCTTTSVMISIPSMLHLFAVHWRTTSSLGIGQFIKPTRFPQSKEGIHHRGMHRSLANILLRVELNRMSSGLRSRRLQSAAMPGEVETPERSLRCLLQ